MGDVHATGLNHHQCSQRMVNNEPSYQTQPRKSLKVLASVRLATLILLEVDPMAFADTKTNSSFLTDMFIYTQKYDSYILE